MRVFYRKKPVHSARMIYGDARISTNGQSLAAQVEG
jgi:hypothetical protein